MDTPKNPECGNECGNESGNVFRNCTAEKRIIPALKSLISDSAHKGEVFEHHRPGLIASQL